MTMLNVSYSKTKEKQREKITICCRIVMQKVNVTVNSRLT